MAIPPAQGFRDFLGSLLLATPELLLLPSLFQNGIGPIFPIMRHRRKMLCENLPDVCHSNHNCFRKISTFQQRFHGGDHAAPKTISALSMDGHVADDSELVRLRCHENHHGIPHRSAIHLQLEEAAVGKSQRINSPVMAYIYTNLSACPFFRRGNRRYNPLMIDGSQELLRFHAESPIGSPTTTRTAAATVTSAPRKSTTTTAATTREAATATAAAHPPDTSGSARSRACVNRPTARTA